MKEPQEKIRCGSCELVQWRDRESCRRCGARLPKPIVKVVERVVEKIIVRGAPLCLEELEKAQELLAAASERLAQSSTETAPVLNHMQIANADGFPTMAEVERTMILAAYRRSHRKPLEAARLLGIGKTTMYRKLREFERSAA